jgi:hypothetical protein
MEEEKVSYDYLGVIKSLIGRVSVDAQNYFCSEIRYDLIREAFDGYPQGQDREAMRKIIGKSMEALGGRAPTPADEPRMGLSLPGIKIFDWEGENGKSTGSAEKSESCRSGE